MTKEKRYQHITKFTVAVDCIVFGFDGTRLKILLVKRGLEPEKGKWSLMGGFVNDKESADTAANRILKTLTGLEGIYLEQYHTFSSPDRDPVQRTISVAYFALIDINKYKESINTDFEAQWFNIKEFPNLIFDHNDMVHLAQKNYSTRRLRILFCLSCYQRSLHCLYCKVFLKMFLIPVLIRVISVVRCYPQSS